MPEPFNSLVGLGKIRKSEIMADVPLYVISEHTSSERRITPAWTIATLRTKLEHITGVPPSSQKLSLKTATGSVPIEAADEDATHLTSFPLAPYAELHVSDANLFPFLSVIWDRGMVRGQPNGALNRNSVQSDGI